MQQQRLRYRSHASPDSSGRIGTESWWFTCHLIETDNATRTGISVRQRDSPELGSEPSNTERERERSSHDEFIKPVRRLTLNGRYYFYGTKKVDWKLKSAIFFFFLFGSRTGQSWHVIVAHSSQNLEAGRVTRFWLSLKWVNPSCAWNISGWARLQLVFCRCSSYNHFISKNS
jgi:hypothetical protein